MKSTAILTLIALAGAPHPGSAQTRLSPTPESVRWTVPGGAEAWVGPTTGQPIATLPGVRPEQNPPEDERAGSGASQTAGAIVLASVGSFVGLYGGALLGYMVAGGDGESEFASLEGLMLGTGFGTLLGAGLGATAATHNPRGSFLGSILGSLAGVGMAYALDTSGPGGDGTRYITYSLTHGVVTGLVVSR